MKTVPIIRPAWRADWTDPGSSFHLGGGRSHPISRSRMRKGACAFVRIDKTPRRTLDGVGRGLRRSRLFLLSLLLAGPSCKPHHSKMDREIADFVIQATLSTNITHIGDPVEIRLTTAHPDTARVEWPRFEREKEILVRDLRISNRRLAPGRQQTLLRATISSLALGEHMLTTGSVRFLLADGTQREEPLPSLSIRVESLIRDPQTVLRDIKGLARWPARVPRWLLVLLTVAALAVLFGWASRRFLSKPRTILHHPPPPPPHEIARRALRRLLEKGWIEQGLCEPFYVELSGIVRRYLEDRFGLRAPERTTEEFIREASVSGVLQLSHQALVRNFLEQSDLVKFARFRPDPPQMRTAFAAAERLVEETVPPPQVPEEKRP